MKDVLNTIGTEILMNSALERLIELEVLRACSYHSNRKVLRWLMAASEMTKELGRRTTMILEKPIRIGIATMTG